ncbi:MAG: AI-2E family transporter [Betaproteobacteria bacterium]
MDELPADTLNQPRAIGRADVRGVAVAVFTGACAIFLVRASATLLAPLMVSVLLAYALEPCVALLMRCRLPRALAIVVVYVMLIAGCAAAALLAQRQATAFVDALPATVVDIRDAIARGRGHARRSRAPGPIEHLQHAATDLEAAIEASTPATTVPVVRMTPVKPPFNVRGYLAAASGAIAAATARLMAIAILTLLLLFGGEALKRKLIAIAGPRAQKKVTHDVIKAIDRQIERYLVARLLISVMVAGGTWIGLWLLGVRQPLVLGVIAGVLNVMPFIGPAAAVALIACVAFLQFHTVEMTAAAAGVAGLVAALEGNLISPWLTSRAGELNTVAVFVSVLFWGWMWDAWGLVLAIPIVVAVKAAADHIEPLQPLGELLGR